MQKYGSWTEQEDTQFRTSGDNKVLTLTPPSSLTGASLALTLPDEAGTTGTLISRTSSDTGSDRLQNKDLSDDNVLFVDSADTTKKLAFQLSGITTATTRTLTVPDASDTLALLAEAQTLTNKTLTTPVIAQISNTGTLTLPTSTDTLVGRDTTDTLTNKTIDGDNNTISNLAHGAEVDNPSSGVHGVTGSVVGTTDSQTLTNKTLTSPVIDTQITGTALETNLSTSALSTKVPTAAAAKAYADSVGGGNNLYQLADNANYTITDSDNVRTVGADSSTIGGGNVNVTLPTPADNEDRIITVIKLNGTGGTHPNNTTITIVRDGAESIGGTAADAVLTFLNETITVQSDGTDWQVLERRDINNCVFNAYLGSNLAIGTSRTILQLDTEAFDPSSVFNTTNYRFTAPVAGFYQLNGLVSYTSEGGADIGFVTVLRKNGTTDIARHTIVHGNNGAANKSSAVGGLFQLSAGDYIELTAECTTARTAVNGTDKTYLTGYLVKLS